MKVYGNVTLSEGSDFKNLTVDHGDNYPANPNLGELFYHDISGLACYNGTSWTPISNGGTFEIPDGSITDAKLSLSGATAGTFSKLTINSKGRVTLGANLSSGDITSSLGFTPVNKQGDIMQGDLGFPASSGTAIKIGTTYGWKDLIGDVAGKSSGTAAPQQKTLFSTVRAWAYSAGDQGDLLFHIPHDYAPGTDMFLHFHWTHNGTNISGNLVLNCNITYAKGHQQMSFVTPVVSTITTAALSIANSPQYQHRIEEVQITSVGGSASMLKTEDIEVDGLLMVSFTASTIPAITGSTTGNNVPFLLSADLHYQTTSLPTKNKSPNFYA